MEIHNNKTKFNGNWISLFIGRSGTEIEIEDEIQIKCRYWNESQDKSRTHVSELFSPAPINVAPIISSHSHRKRTHFNAIWDTSIYVRFSLLLACLCSRRIEFILPAASGKSAAEWESEKLQRKICLLCMLSAIIIFYFYFHTLGFLSSCCAA